MFFAIRGDGRVNRPERYFASKHTPILKGLLQFAEFGPDRQRLIGTKAPKFKNLVKIAVSLYQGGKGPLRV